MHLDLDDAHADELRTVLDDTIRDLSHEIADTDNPGFRDQLRTRRERLQHVRSLLGG